MPRKRGQRPRSAIPTPIFKVEEQLRPVVSCKKRHTIVALQHLLAKWAYEPERFTSEDVLVFHELYLRAVDLSEQDYNYRKYLLPLKGMQALVRGLVVSPETSHHRKTLWSLESPSVWFLPDKFGYFGVKGQDLRLWKLSMKPPRLRKFPIQRRVGVGYRDKGSLRLSAEDGSPTWKEVATRRRARSNITVGDVWGSYSFSNPPTGLFYDRNGPGNTEKPREQLGWGRTQTVTR
jgi:hypothetical protein